MPASVSLNSTIMAAVVPDLPGHGNFSKHTFTIVELSQYDGCCWGTETIGLGFGTNPFLGPVKTLWFGLKETLP